jgi:hypothetical protein
MQRTSGSAAYRGPKGRAEVSTACRHTVLSSKNVRSYAHIYLDIYQLEI